MKENLSLDWTSLLINESTQFYGNYSNQEDERMKVVKLTLGWNLQKLSYVTLAALAWFY